VPQVAPLAPADAPPAASGSASRSAGEAAKLPQRTLQVGAFRQQKSATNLHEKLAAAFSDVTIVEVQSGGESLYRVIVGRMPHGPALDDLRHRLVAAGYPAFEVPAPPPAAN
jgi:cell division protein FtsN